MQIQNWHKAQKSFIHFPTIWTFWHRGKWDLMLNHLLWKHFHHLSTAERKFKDILPAYNTLGDANFLFILLKNLIKWTKDFFTLCYRYFNFFFFKLVNKSVWFPSPVNIIGDSYHHCCTKTSDIQIEKNLRRRKKMFKNELLCGQVNQWVKNLNIFNENINIFSTPFH